MKHTCLKGVRATTMACLLGCAPIVAWGQGFSGPLLNAPGDPVDSLSAGFDDYSRGNWSGAIAAWQHALTGALPDDQRTSVEFFLSEALLFGGNPQQAAEGYESVLTREPTGPWSMYAAYRRGEIAVQLQYPNEAQQLLQDFVAQHPGTESATDGRLLLGQLALQQGDLATAQQWFAQCISGQVTDRQQALGLLGLSQIEFFTGNLDRSAATLQQISSRQPLDATTAWNVRFWNGMVDLARGQYGSAVTALQASAQQAGDSSMAAVAYLHTGEAYTGLQQWTYADLYFQEVLKRWPASSLAADALVGRMRAAIAQQNYTEVEPLARQFVQRYAGSELEGTTTRLMGQALNGQGQYESALRYFDSLVARDPQLSTELGLRAAYGRGVALAGMGRYADASSTFDQIDRSPQLTAAGRRVLREAQLTLRQYGGTAAGGGTTPWPGTGPGTNPWGGGSGSGTGPGGGVSAAASPALQAIQRQVQAGDYLDALNAIQTNFNQLARDGQLPETVRQIAEKSRGTSQQTVVDNMLNQWAGGSGELAAYGYWGRSAAAAKTRQTAAAMTDVNRVLNATNTDPLTSEALMMRAQLYEQQQNWAAAGQDYAALVQRLGTDPRAAHAMLNAARMAERQQDYPAALNYLKQLKTQFPGHPREDGAAYLEAWIYMDQGQPTQAEPLFQQIHQRYPNSRYWNDSTYRLAEMAFQRGNYGVSAQLLNEVLAGTEDPEVWPHAIFLKGQVFAAQRDWPAARQQFNLLLTRYPNHALQDLSTYWLGESYFQQRNFPAAQQQFNSLSGAVSNGTENWKGMVLLRQAQLADAAGQWDQVSQLLTQLKTRFPQLNRADEIDYLTARLLAAENRQADARQQLQTLFNRTQTSNPETAAMAQWMVGETYFNEKQYQQAISAYSVVIQRFAAYPYWVAAAYFKTAVSYEALGRFADAERIYYTLLGEPAYQQTEFAAQAGKRLMSMPSQPQPGG